MLAAQRDGDQSALPSLGRVQERAQPDQRVARRLQPRAGHGSAESFQAWQGRALGSTDQVRRVDGDRDAGQIHLRALGHAWQVRVKTIVAAGPDDTLHYMWITIHRPQMAKSKKNDSTALKLEGEFDSNTVMGSNYPGYVVQRQGKTKVNLLLRS